VSPDRESPRWVSETMLLAIHAQQIERFGGSHGVIDQNVVLSALARPINRWGYDDPSDLADLAAAYLVGFSRSQGFSDGNKRTALACSLVFLALNGFAIHVPARELYALVMAAAVKTIDDTQVAAFFRERMVERSS
jgi:death-on-curing protein